MWLQPWEIETLLLDAVAIALAVLLFRFIQRVAARYRRWTIAHWMIATFVIGLFLALVVRPMMSTYAR